MLLTEVNPRRHTQLEEEGWGLFVPLTHVASGRVVMFQICHLLQTWRHPRASASHTEVRSGRKLQRRTVRRHPDWAICRGADWNVDADRSLEVEQSNLEDGARLAAR
jgi:hypothetical protein